MRKSFYTWLMTGAIPKAMLPRPLLADPGLSWDSLSKHTDDFDEVSRFLGMQDFSFNLGDFDAIWEEYLGH